MRTEFILTMTLASAFAISAAYFYPPAWHIFWLLGPIILLGTYHMLQTKHTLLRNFPVLGYGRYFMETLRPGVQQYFIESNTDGSPLNREFRNIIYQRAKGVMDTVPFGTQHDVYQVGYEWINHSIRPLPIPHEQPRVLIGGDTCAKPYSASVFNISAMSFGSLSKNAVMALNKGAMAGQFAHNTGEGGVSPYHLQGGDLIWQIGTGYFGACAEAGIFSAERFRDTASHDNIKMIELKLSQGAKPGHGGILPAAKLTPEIAAIRGVPMGKDVNSPPWHSSFNTPKELCSFISQLRELSGGKPIGMKLCVGKRREFLAICKAIHETGIHPDYIAVDGGEGGTGAAPLEFSNSVGCPLKDGLVFVHNSLVGFGLRDKIKLVASGKNATGFDLIRVMSLGADMGYSARAMMLAIGCIQARHCNSNQCPVGVATQRAHLVNGLVVTDKAERVHRYHEQTVHSMMELLCASGMNHPEQLRPWHIMRRISPQLTQHYGEIYKYIEKGSLLHQDSLPPSFARAWQHATADSFDSVDE